MKIGVTSDIHSKLPLEKDRKILEECDIVCFCGDVLDGYSIKSYENKKILEWISSMTKNGTNVIMTPGNHDIFLYRTWLSEKNLPIDTYCRNIFEVKDYGSLDYFKENYGLEILVDRARKIKGVQFYGTPWSPKFCNWAFMKDDNELYDIFRKIPEDTDILLSHTPPAPLNGDFKWDIDISDYDRTIHCGSKSLTRIIEERLRDSLCYCGHIHSGDHATTYWIKDGNWIKNVSYVGEDYQPHYEPYVFEVIP